MNNYVEQVETDKIMNGAMRGLPKGSTLTAPG